MKLNNKGFAVSTIMYMILVLAVLVMALTLTALNGRKLIIDKQKNIALTNIYKGFPRHYNAYTPGQLIQFDPVNNETCITGETCYKWRVITVGDTISNSNITLQMDHNLVNLSAWVSKADYNDDTNYGTNGNINKGPITALKALEIATANWDNSLKLTYSYVTIASPNNYGVLSCTDGTCTVAGNRITTNLKARMITIEEITAITKAAGAAEGTNAYNWTLASSNWYYFSNTEYTLGTQSNVPSGQTGSTDLAWLIENTDANSNSGATANAYGNINYGYWSLSPSSGNSYFAWCVNRNGRTDNLSLNRDNVFGIRPVITIEKRLINN